MLGVADGVGGVEAGDLGLWRGGGQGFFQFGLLGARVFFGFGCLAVELFGGELLVGGGRVLVVAVEEGVIERSAGHGEKLRGSLEEDAGTVFRKGGEQCTLRLKRAFSRPDMVAVVWVAALQITMLLSDVQAAIQCGFGCPRSDSGRLCGG